MSATVEHEKRKREILERALDVFVDEGYADTTFQKIADRCGITRTILYLYFKNKREVFNFSIKRFTERMEEDIALAIAEDKTHAADKLERVIILILESCVENARLLSVIMDYLGHMKRSGGDTSERVRRRTIRLRHIMAGIVIAGQKKGELSKVPVKPVIELFYSLVESAIFKVTLLGERSVEGPSSAARLFITRLKN